MTDTDTSDAIQTSDTNHSALSKSGSSKKKNVSFNIKDDVKIIPNETEYIEDDFHMSRDDHLNNQNPGSSYQFSNNFSRSSGINNSKNNSQHQHHYDPISHQLNEKLTFLNKELENYFRGW